MNAEMLTQFFVQGYVLTRDHGVDIRYFDDLPIQDCNDDTASGKSALTLDLTARSKLREIHAELASRFLRPAFHQFELKDCTMWSGVDRMSARWHNDFEDGDAFNSNILIYLDDNTVENGNSVEIRGPGFEHLLRPLKGDLLWLNQKKCFQHKATHQSGIRRLLSFEFFVPALC